jgi:hypothetical protein
MSRANDEKKYNSTKSATGPGQPAAEGKGQLISFNPNEAQKQVIKQLSADTKRVVIGFEALTARGVKVSMGFMEKSGAFYCIARQITQDWRDAVGISAVHTSIDVAMASCLYACTEVYAGFPVYVPQYEQQLFDW